MSDQNQQGSTGRFKSVSKVLPPVKVIMQPAPNVFMELILKMTKPVDDRQLLRDVEVLVDHLDAHEKSLGGLGIAWDKAVAGIDALDFFAQVVL